MVAEHKDILARVVPGLMVHIPMVAGKGALVEDMPLVLVAVRSRRRHSLAVGAEHIAERIVVGCNRIVVEREMVHCQRKQRTTRTRLQ
jgi:hypothetical protein